MAKEIERKFLIEELPSSVIEGKKACHILQGYITADPTGQQVRLRSKNDQYSLTVKGKGQLEREEVEITLHTQQFEALWPLTEGRRIVKKRYEIPYHSLTIELDIFEKSLTGLRVAEIEFDSVAVSEKLQVPDWFGKEVTEDARYTNSQLAQSQSIPT